MLRQIGLAQQAIAKKQTRSAQERVNQAVADQAQIASAARAHGLSTVVPLYSEFDEDSVLGPLQAQRKKQQPGSSSNSIGVEQTTGQFTFVGMDLDKAKQHLDAAKTALDNKNLESANDSLAAVGNELVMETVDSDQPLLTARENLGLAESAAKKGHYRETSTALKDASSALNRYANKSAMHHAQEAKDLSGTINSYSQSVMQNHADAAGKIDGWWHQVNNWFSKSPSA